MKLLIVEDSPRLRSSLTQGLTKLGYAVDAVADGRNALHYILSVDYDVIILDIRLPQLDGLSVLKQMRAQQNKAHVLILSAKDQTQDRIDGLRLGADDYMVKPFSFDELQARIGALLRRSYNHKNPLVQLGALEYNTALKVLRCAGAPIPLTPHELSLFEYLLMNRGHVVEYQHTALAAGALALAACGESVEAPFDRGVCYAVEAGAEGEAPRFNKVADNQPQIEFCAARLEEVRLRFLRMGGTRQEITGSYQGQFIFIDRAGVWISPTLEGGRFNLMARTGDGRLAMPGAIQRAIDGTPVAVSATSEPDPTVAPAP